MTMYFFTDKRAAHHGVVLLENNPSGEVYFYEINKKPSEVTLKPGLAKLVTKVTWHESRWASDGYRYLLGLYEGDGWKAEITRKQETRGSGPTRTMGTMYCIRGEFKDLATLVAFDQELTYGCLKPTIPLGGVPQPEDVKYSTLAVKNSARISNLEATVAQLMNHIRDVEQIIQDTVFAPKNL
jgi:hypothetical protein